MGNSRIVSGDLVYPQEAMQQLGIIDDDKVVELVMSARLAHPSRDEAGRMVWTQDDLDTTKAILAIEAPHRAVETLGDALDYVRQSVWPTLAKIEMVFLIPEDVPDECMDMMKGLVVRVRSMIWPNWHVMRRDEDGEDTAFNNVLADIEGDRRDQ